MMVLPRKILFYLFTVTYVVVCPLLILYALGYVYNPLKEGLVRTGVIRLSTVPAGASVYLEKSRFTRSTPAIIEELLPGRYQITLEKNRYKRWAQTVSLEAGKAVAFENVLLIPQQWPITNVSPQPYTDLFPLARQGQFLLTKDAALGNCVVYETGHAPRPLLDPESPLSDLSVTEIRPIIDGKNVLVQVGSFWNRNIFLFDPYRKRSVPSDVTQWFDGKLPELIWQGNDKDIVYFLRDQSIWQIDRESPKDASPVLKNVIGFGVRDKWIYAITTDLGLVRSPYDKWQPEPLLDDMLLARRFFNKSDFYRIHVTDNDIIAFLGSQGDLVLNVPPYTVAAQDVVDFTFNKDEDLLLYWTENEINVVDFTTRQDETVFHEKFLTRPIHANASNIKQCFWAWHDSHLLCNDADTVDLIEIEPQGPNHVEPICRILRRSTIYYDNDKQTLYYLQENTGKLMSIRIVP